MAEQQYLRKLYELFFEASTTKDLPNINEKMKASNKFYNFMEKVKENPELLGDDDSKLNEYLAEYLQEYAFSAFGIGFALGKNIESETKLFATHVESAHPID